MTSLLLLALLSANAPKIASPAWNVVDVKPELAGSTDLQTWDDVLLGLNNRRIEAVAVCPHGRGVVTQNGPPSIVNFTSVWCAPDNTIWALTERGYVVHRTSGSYVMEYTGWGHEQTSSFIGGTSSRVFIMGDDGAILTRPLVP
jgi:hypothetical protein